MLAVWFKVKKEETENTVDVLRVPVIDKAVELSVEDGVVFAHPVKLKQAMNVATANNLEPFHQYFDVPFFSMGFFSWLEWIYYDEIKKIIRHFF